MTAGSGASVTCRHCGDPIDLTHQRIWPDSVNHVTCAGKPMVDGVCPFDGNPNMCGKHGTPRALGDHSTSRSVNGDGALVITNKNEDPRVAEARRYVVEPHLRELAEGRGVDLDVLIALLAAYDEKGASA